MFDNGYYSKEYQQVYKVHGTIDHETNMIVRPIPLSGYQDAISIYPFDLDAHQHSLEVAERHAGIVSSIGISDPLGMPLTDRPSTEAYKHHHICDLKKYSEHTLPENHRRNIKKCFKTGHIAMNMLPNVIGTAAACHQVYQNLVRRHEIPDAWFTNYSQEQFEHLLEAPGAILFQYFGKDNALEGISLFYFNGANVYYHLSAQSEVAYENASMFGMMHTALRFFKKLGANRVVLGSVPEGGSDGLERFKAGFSHNWKHNYITRIIHDQEAYEILSKGKESTGFFPQYRS